MLMLEPTRTLQGSAIGCSIVTMPVTVMALFGSWI
jgi:hypothetical protein